MQTDLHPIQPIALNYALGTVPDWINILPAGPGVVGVDGRRWTMNDADAVIETFRRRGNRLPVDLEHATLRQGAANQPAPAVGQIFEMEKRDNGIWAKVKWNEAGEFLLRSGAYAHCSPVFWHPDGNISALHSVALTNNPNLDLVALNAAGQTNQETQSMDKAVLEALGLNASATAADAVVAIRKLEDARDVALNQAKAPDPEKFVPKADHELALNKVQAFEQAETEREEKAIEGAVDAAIEAGKVAPASRDFHIAACQVNGLKKFAAMIGEMPVIVGAARTKAKTAANSAASKHGLDAEELAMCRALDMTPEAFAEGKKELEA